MYSGSVALGLISRGARPMYILLYVKCIQPVAVCANSVRGMSDLGMSILPNRLYCPGVVGLCTLGLD